eukprot:jgi/Tetstr1/434293/TSEL_023400.t1
MEAPTLGSREDSGAAVTLDMPGQSGKSSGAASENGGKKRAVCQVAGCTADLAALKEYNVRFKICRFHQQAEMVLREDTPSRFCQQCARFHPLAVFDGTKRSCRTSLELLNERRRKHKTVNRTPSQSHSLGAAPSAPSPEDGSQFSHSTASEVRKRPAVPDVALGNASKWKSASEGGPAVMNRFHHQRNGVLKTEDNDPCVPMRDLDRFAGMPSTKPLPAIHCMWTDAHSAEDMVLPALPNARRPRSAAAGQAIDLGIWSSGSQQQPPPQDAGPHDPQQEQQQQQPGMSPFCSNDFTDAVFNGMETSRRSSMMAVENPSASAQHSLMHQSSGGFGMQDGHALASGCQGRHTWGGNMQQNPGQSMFEADLRKMGVLDFPDMSSDMSFSANAMGRAASMGTVDETGPAVEYSYDGFPRSAPVPGSMPDAAPSTLVYHMSMKLFGAKPADLPYALRPKILSWLQDMPVDVEGCIRPGCVHLTVSLTFASTEHYQRALESVPAGILASLEEAGPGCSLPWCSKDTGVWLPDRWMNLRAGKLVASGWHEASAAPTVEAPLAATSADSVRILGRRSADRGCKLLCRLAGEYHDLPVTWVEHEGGENAAVARLPATLGEGGAAWLEVVYVKKESSAASCWLEMSHPRPILMCKSASIAKQASATWAGIAAQPGHGSELLLQVLDALLHQRPANHQCAPAAQLFVSCVSDVARNNMVLHMRLLELLAHVRKSAPRAGQPWMALTLGQRKVFNAH